MNESVVEVHLESPLPASLRAGTCTALYCSGSAVAAGGRQILALGIGLERKATAVRALGMPRFDLPIRRSGFWGVIPVQAPAAPGPARLIAAVELSDGTRAEVALGAIEIAPSAGTAAASSERIAICLATFNPDPRLLLAQIGSLRAQTDRDWVCLISDDCSDPAAYADLERMVRGDQRFVLSRSPERIGFYRNFERALGMVAPDTPLVALCDQDDLWHADKLARLRAALHQATDASLAYCDMRLVDEAGHVLRETLWRGRANNHTSLASLLVANTITGAAMLMRREVVERALPFPDSPGIEFHDHWLALVAFGCGRLVYLDEALYDYVQHGAAILGKVAATGSVPAPRTRLQLRRWRAAYFLGYIPGVIRARTLLGRCGDGLSSRQRRALERYIAAEHSLIGLAWLALRPLRALAGRTETLAGEWDLLPGLLWIRAARRLAGRRWPERLALDTALPDPPVFEHRRLRRWRARTRA